MQGLANKVADGNCEILANRMNDLFVSVSEHLPRLNVDNEVFTVEGELPDECIIIIQTTFKALCNIKTNKANMYGAFDVVLYFVVIQLFWLLINLLLILS